MKKFTCYFLLLIFISSSCLANIYWVTTVDLYSDNGLNQKLDSSVLHPGFDTIYFNIPGMSPHIIDYTTLTYQFQSLVLPSQILIDGNSQPANGYNGDEPKIWISSSIGNYCYVENGSHVKIFSMKFLLIVIASGSDLMFGDYGRGNHFQSQDYDDLRLSDVHNATIRGNLFNGQAYDNIQLVNCDSVYIQGNKMGVNFAGDSTVGGTYSGIILRAGVTNCLIGGVNSIERNLISGECYSNIQLGGGPVVATDTFDVTSNEVIGNILGMNENVDSALGSSYCSIMISGSVFHNVIGTDEANGANWISNGIRYFDSIPQFNIFKNNYMPCLEYYLNFSQGINILYSSYFPFGCGNGCKPNPIIDSVASNGVKGMVVAYDTVRVFYVDTCDFCYTAISFLGKVIAAGDGQWSLSYAVDTSTRIVVTATDTFGNTSQFSNCNYTVANSIIDGVVNSPSPVFEIIPNPASNFFKVNLLSGSKTRLTAVSEFGKVAFAKTVSSSEVISCMNWQNGVYLIMAQNADGTIMSAKKIVVIHQ